MSDYTAHQSYILQRNDDMDPEYMGRLVRSSGNAEDTNNRNSPLNPRIQGD